jgi:DNA-binding CsgD family transcriptional regulator
MNKFKHPASVVSSFYEGIESPDSISDEDSFVFDLDIFSSMSIEAVYVLDFQKRCFHYVSGHELFLCGHSQQEVMRLGYDFYSEAVHPEDFPKLVRMHNAVLKLLDSGDEVIDDINYFSFSLRIKNRLQRGNRPEYLMVYHKLKPIFIGGQIRFGVCLLTCSVMPETGNLRIYYRSNQDFSEYSFASRRWKRQATEHLTEQEALILMFAKQRISHRKIAEKLFITYGSLRSAIMRLCRKLNAETLEQAVIHATNHLMIFDSEPAVIRKKEENGSEKHPGKLTPEVLHHLQSCLDNKQSINSIAKDSSISRGAIYAALKSGKLIKNNGS